MWYRNLLHVGFVVVLWRLAFIYINLWSSVAIMKPLPLLFSASAFCNYLLREDFDCSFLRNSRNHADLLWKKRLGGPLHIYTCLCTINLMPHCVPVHQLIKKEIGPATYCRLGLGPQASHLNLVLRWHTLFKAMFLLKQQRWMYSSRKWFRS